MVRYQVLLILGFISGIFTERDLTCEEFNGPKSTFLWSINSPNLNTTSYLFGTYHVKNLWDYVSPIAKKVFDTIDVLALELDLEIGLAIAKFNRSAIKNECVFLPNGTTIKNFLSHNQFDKFEKALDYVFMDAQKRNVKINLTKDWYYQLRPEVTIRDYHKIFTMRENETENIFLDVLLGLKAKSNNKPVIGIEKLDEQICYGLNLTRYQRNLAFDIILKQVPINKTYHELIDNSLTYYKCRIMNKTIFTHEDNLKFVKEAIKKLKPYKYLLKDEWKFANNNKRLFHKWHIRPMVVRNTAMTERVDKILRANPTKRYFIAFGLSHFVGPNNIGEMLKKLGYKVEEVHENYIIPEKPAYIVPEKPAYNSTNRQSFFSFLLYCLIFLLFL